MTECRRCGNSLPESGLSSLKPLHCPQCGASLGQEKSPFDAASQIVQNYFRDIWLILTQPSHFFKKMPLTGGISRPLAFALVTHWLGSALSFLWKLYLFGSLMKFAQPFLPIMGDVLDIHYPGKGQNFLMARDRFVQWFTSAGPVLIDPFLTLASILLTSFFVFIGAKILANSSKQSGVQVTYESAVRLICFGITPAILAALPLFGTFVSYVYIIFVTTIGAKEIYRVSTGRGLVIALFPKLLFLGTIGVGLALFFLTLLKFFTSFIN